MNVNVNTTVSVMQEQDKSFLLRLLNGYSIRACRREFVLCVLYFYIWVYAIKWCVKRAEKMIVGIPNFVYLSNKRIPFYNAGCVGCNGDGSWKSNWTFIPLRHLASLMGFSLCHFENGLVIIYPEVMRQMKVSQALRIPCGHHIVDE